MLGAGGLLAVFVEPLLLVRLQREPARLVTAGGLAVLALELLACALAPHPLVVLAAFVLAGPASGVACAFAQATLAELERAGGHRHAAERATSRWNLAGALGDVAAPALLVAAGDGWRWAYLAAAAAAAGLAVAVLAARAGRGPAAPHARAEDEPAARPFTLRELLAARGVLLAALAATACTLLDEIVLAVGALWLDERFALGTAERSALLGGWTVAALAGSAALGAAVRRFPAERLLAVSGGGCAVAFALALAAPAPAAAGVPLAAAGFLASWHWPLCTALALRAAGDRPLLAGAAASLWSPLDLAAPFVVAALAGAHGPALAMTSLLLQPAAVAAAGLAWSRAARRRRADRMRARDELAPRPVAAAEPRATRPARGTEGS